MEHKVMMVGHGVISKTYLDAIKKIDGMAVVGVLGRDMEKVEKYAKENGIPRYDTDFTRLADAAQASMVIVCTPNAVHYQNVLDAASRGLHILCEKPLHIIPDKQNEMIAVCRKNNVKLGISFMRRFSKHIKYVKDFIDAGKLGKILVMDVYIKLWRKTEYYTASSWHGTSEIDGGGPYMQQGSHMIDVAVWLAGGYDKVIASRMFTLYHPIKVEDHGYAIVRYANNAVGVIEASTVCKGQGVDRIEISASGGTIHLDGQGICHWNVEDHEQPDFSGENDVFCALVKDFKEAIENDRDPFVTGESAKHAVELINKIYDMNDQQSYYKTCRKT